MPHRHARPFPIQLEVDFLDRLSEPVRDKKVKSVSELIRAALTRFDFENAVVVKPQHVQISVRLEPEIRKNLKRHSRGKHTSVGQLVRSAVEAYLPELEALPHPEEVKPAPKGRPKRSAKKTPVAKKAPKKSAKPKKR